MASRENLSPASRPTTLRILFAAAGLITLGLGIAGFVIPGLPGTPLLLVAAWLFSMSSERLYRWTTTNRWFGQAIADYRAGLGIPRRTKFVAITMVTVVISLSVIFGLNNWWLRALVIVLGLYGISFIITRPTRELIESR